MALNSLLCAHVPLRNCSLTHSLIPHTLGKSGATKTSVCPSSVLILVWEKSPLLVVSARKTYKIQMGMCHFIFSFRFKLLAPELLISHISHSKFQNSFSHFSRVLVMHILKIWGYIFSPQKHSKTSDNENAYTKPCYL